MDTVDLALNEIARLRKLIKKKSTSQVWSSDERSIAKATALAWFNSHRGNLSNVGASSNFQDTDASYKRLLEATVRATSRATYNNLLKNLRETLIALRSEGASQPQLTPDNAPSFAPLIADLKMQRILGDRWRECVTCINAGAPLSATVMMGGLLEALLLGRINRESSMDQIFKAKAAPKDKNGHPKALPEWMLKNYIDVAREMGWISISAKDVGVVLRDYRNYIHPFKQLSHGVNLTNDDALLLWEVSKAVTREVINSAQIPDWMT